MLASYQGQFVKNKANDSKANNSTLIYDNSNGKAANQSSKSLLNNIFSQMNYNDLKKQKIKQAKNEIWSQFVDICIKNSIDPQTHVSNLCKQHKIVL